MSWLDTKYVMLLSGRMERFKKVGNNFNFRCPLCGDSQKQRTKARGWVLFKNGKSRYYCHNCNANLRLSDFIKKLDVSLYYEYIKDLMLEKNESKPEVHQFADKMKKPEFVKTTNIGNLKKISQLAVDHPAKLYVHSRLIPTEFHHKLFFAPKFKKWVNTMIPNKFENTEHDEPRLIIPFLDQDKKLFGFQGRSFRKNSQVKYVTIILDEEKPKLFGLDTLDISKRIYVFEGPIDSMFIPNSLASCGGRLDTNLSEVEGFKTIVYDNEPRSKETVDKMESAINCGFSVCFWPETIIYKDVNDMVLKGGLDKGTVKEIIDQNTYSGLEARLKLATWKKI